MKKNYLFFSLLLFILFSSYASLSLCSPLLIKNLTIEDGLVETLSAIFYFAAGSLMLLLFINAKSLQQSYVFGWRRNIFCLLLSIFFFACCGEEISWGQRIFHLTTPPYLQRANLQHEINLHNLVILNGNGNKHSVTGLLINVFFSANGLYSLVWIFYGFVLPLLTHLDTRVERQTARVSLPVFSLGLGLMFILNFGIFKIFSALSLYEQDKTPLVELKETLIAFLYMVGSLQLLATYNQRSCGIKAGKFRWAQSS